MQSHETEKTSLSLIYQDKTNLTFSEEEVAKLALAVAQEKQAFRPILLDLREVSPITNFFVIVSASSTRQAKGIYQEITAFFKNNFSLKPLSIDGLESGTWILVDFGFLFIHIFQEATREAYQLERLWNKGNLIPIVDQDLRTFYKYFLHHLG